MSVRRPVARAGTLTAPELWESAEPATAEHPVAQELGLEPADLGMFRQLGTELLFGLADAHTTSASSPPIAIIAISPGRTERIIGSGPARRTLGAELFDRTAAGSPLRLTSSVVRALALHRAHRAAVVVAVGIEEVADLVRARMPNANVTIEDSGAITPEAAPDAPSPNGKSELEEEPGPQFELEAEGAIEPDPGPEEEEDRPPPEPGTEPEAAPADGEATDNEGPVTLNDFRAYMPEHKYIFRPSRELWPASSVDSRIPPIPEEGETLKASKWLDRHRPVEQMTWIPGEPEIIEGRLVSHGGYIEREGVSCFNLYRAPRIEPGDPKKAGPWVDHGFRIFPDSMDHISLWLAHRVQRPHEKINHALALIGPQGTGKDTLIEGAIPGVGPWNVWEVGPEAVMGRFNPHTKSVILRVSEARDLGDVDRYRLYEHLKTLTAAPPHVLRVDEKNVREYMVPNVVGVVITSNHTDGIYLPADDRRHYVAATELTKEDFTEQYWTKLWGWYENGGFRHVAAYLHSLDLTGFNPKAPPPKTAAFWQVVDAGRAPEDAELADVLDKLQEPDAISLHELRKQADPDFADWLKDRRNRRQIPHRLKEAGYVQVRNDAAKDGRWKVGGRLQSIYAKRDLPIRDRIRAAQRIVEAGR